MCLLALGVDLSRRFPLVIAANRDEFFNRPAAPLSWWQPGPGAPEVLGGRDLHAGGTWMGLTRGGRFGLLTNVRQPDRVDPDAPSRGEIVPLWLRGDLPMDRFWMRVALNGYNGFNLIAGDLAAGECFWASNHAKHPLRIERGLHAVSNAQLNTPWPKVERLKQQLGAAVMEAASAEALAEQLFHALADSTPVDEALLPRTGIPPDWERWLATAFVRTPDGRYGTRCSTVLITERGRRGWVTHVIERSFAPGPELQPAGVSRMLLQDWPPEPATPPGAAADAGQGLTGA